ncbi:prepilin-type N-terminal cleavage/methylation domain-containing protein [Brasilonema sp. UFV-L1]|uniref:pilus assembly FimT family protein n=1 Tax=Brasilonema sp. UFV-L1 TaxID=2234130 RepID=UPI00145DE596|nr:prepilin-type N-terminal cleavage/methylation domain-containing protein [Brasilonema sp. UFV-L1]NMG10492.1 prepilin-type cleavage/methylation domain-containing protein [Brasilonema sp. UFV-L1]
MNEKNLFQNHSSSGFTLLELLISLVILSILAAISMPSWLAFVDIQRLKAAQNEVYLAIRQAQTQAIKNKLTWQVSFREQNGIVQWAVHQAEAKVFIPNAISINNTLWHNLDQNIHIYKDNKGEYETTFPKETTKQEWRIMFNYQGCPVYEVGSECTQTSLRTLGQITLSSKYGGKAKRCVYISTILGAIRTGKEHDKPESKHDESDTYDNKNKYCY